MSWKRDYSLKTNQENEIERDLTSTNRLGDQSLVGSLRFWAEIRFLATVKTVFFIVLLNVLYIVLMLTSKTLRYFI